MRHEPKLFGITNRGDTAEIRIYGPIGGDFFGGVSDEEFAIEYQAVRDAKSLDVRINSPGGDVFEGYAIYSLLAQHRGKVNVFVDGMAASIASVIAMAGDSVEMAASSEIMIHDPSGGVYGRVEDHEKLIDRLKVHAHNIAKTYEARTGNDYEVIRAWMREETTWEPEQAVEVGFASAIAHRKSVAAIALVDPLRIRSLSDHASTRLSEWTSPIFRVVGRDGEIVRPAVAEQKEEKSQLETLEERIQTLKMKARTQDVA